MSGVVSGRAFGAQGGLARHLARKDSATSHDVVGTPCLGYNQGYTATMKTAISIDDGLFDRAERAARRLGVTRSGLYAVALGAYLEAFETEEVTRELDEVYADQSSQLPRGVARLQAASLPDESW